MPKAKTTEVLYRLHYQGHDHAHAHVNFREDGTVECVYCFSGDICQFPRELTAWRPTGGEGGFIDAEEPEKVWEYIRRNGHKGKKDPDPKYRMNWVTSDELPAAVAARM